MKNKVTIYMRYGLFILIIASALMSNQIIAQSWLYLGQQPPGMDPQRFPTDSLLANENWFWHGSPAFSPDGKEMYWVKYQVNLHTEIWFVEYSDSHWTSPQIASFSSGYAENNPVFSESGDSLYYRSTKPGGFIFVVTRTLNGWSVPMPLDIPVPAGLAAGLQFSVTRDKSIYFELWEGLNLDLYKTQYSNGEYLSPVNLGPNINSSSLDFTPFVNPDEEYIIFNSDRPGGAGNNDLYISFNDSNGGWLEIQNMGTGLNTDGTDLWPYVTPDGNYFFFVTDKNETLGFNPYWVDSEILNQFNPSGVANDKSLLRGFRLYQNYPNPFNPITTVTFQIPNNDFVTLSVYDVLGNEITTLINGEKSAGKYKVEFDGIGLSSGIYFYRLRSGNNVKIKKLLLLK